MSKKPTPPPFDALDTAVKVRAGTVKLRDLDPQQAYEVRQKLSHTGRLKTELLRRDAQKRQSSAHPRDGGPLVAALS